MAEFLVELVPGSEVNLTLHTQNGLLEEMGQVVCVTSTGGTVRHGLAFLEPKGRDYLADLFLGRHSDEESGPQRAEGIKA